MKIKFIGVGSAFTTRQYFQSNLLITAGNGRNMLIDCGTDIRFSLSECLSISENHVSDVIDSVYVSHLHSDHIGGMEWLAFQSYFSQRPNRPGLFMEESTMYEMWDCSLKAGLGCIEGKQMHLTDYFRCNAVAGDGVFLWEGIFFTLVKMPHIITGYKNFYSYGLLIEEAGTDGKGCGEKFFFTTDTQFTRKLIMDVSDNVSVIFHDCETSPGKSMVHAHYNDLCTLPSELKRKMWLYHYQPDPVPRPEDDGFAGFVTKGQEFVSHRTEQEKSTRRVSKTSKV
ncbi:MBL fold metallo-hydrolase [Desulfobacterales bacterium HSG16]|nr:MBL fold metallo-hydrolase [Desulfobacterales bacterium HSG16]